MICSGCGDPVTACDCWGFAICRDCAAEGRDLINALIEDVREAELWNLAKLLDWIANDEVNR